MLSDNSSTVITNLEESYYRLEASAKWTFQKTLLTLFQNYFSWFSTPNHAHSIYSPLNYQL